MRQKYRMLSAADEIVFESGPEPGSGGATLGSPPPSVPAVDLFKVVSLWDKATARPSGAYEAPHFKLARLQRETAELVDEFSSAPLAVGADLLAQIDQLRADLDRIGNGGLAAAQGGGVRSAVAAGSALDNVEVRRQVRADAEVETLGGGPATAELLALARTTLGAAAAGENTPVGLIIERFVALRALHEEGVDFAARLRAVETEQARLLSRLRANDQGLQRVAEALKHIEALKYGAVEQEASPV